MSGKCGKCGRFHWRTGLPSAYSNTWLTDNVPVKWYCAECYWRERANVSNQELEIHIEKRYLMPIWHVLPLLGGVAAIVVSCIEIIAHTT